MTYKDYLKSCLAFAEDSADWGDYDDKMWYTTTDGGGWEETIDNRNGGLDVRWAFHLSADEIFENCPSEYAQQIVALWRVSIEAGWDEDEIYDVLDWLVTQNR